MLLLPSNLDVSIAVQKALVAYGWLVSLSKYGKVYKADLKPHKNRADYWTRKLRGAGWITDQGEFWALKSSREVWRLIGVERVYKYGKKAGIIGYHYRRFHFKFDSPSTFFREGLKTIHQFLANRKISQITGRLVMLRGGDPRLRRTVISSEKPRLGCVAIARTLGYASVSSAYSKRKDYFSFVPATGRTVAYVNLHGCTSYKRECGRINLNPRV